jgi:hypothetical protein
MALVMVLVLGLGLGLRLMLGLVLLVLGLPVLVGLVGLGLAGLGLFGHLGLGLLGHLGLGVGLCLVLSCLGLVLPCVLGLSCLICLGFCLALSWACLALCLGFVLPYMSWVLPCLVFCLSGGGGRLALTLSLSLSLFLSFRVCLSVFRFDVQEMLARQEKLRRKRSSRSERLESETRERLRRGPFSQSLPHPLLSTSTSTPPPNGCEGFVFTHQSGEREEERGEDVERPLRVSSPTSDTRSPVGSRSRGLKAQFLAKAQTWVAYNKDNEAHRLILESTFELFHHPTGPIEDVPHMQAYLEGGGGGGWEGAGGGVGGGPDGPCTLSRELQEDELLLLHQTVRFLVFRKQEAWKKWKQVEESHRRQHEAALQKERVVTQQSAVLQAHQKRAGDLALLENTAQVGPFCRLNDHGVPFFRWSHCWCYFSPLSKKAVAILFCRRPRRKNRLTEDV